MSRRLFHTIALLLALFGCAGGCVLTKGLKREPIPPEVRDARLSDASLSGSQYTPVDPQMIAALKRSLQHSCDIERAAHQEETTPINILAISGGGMYGAFDVGVLNGWSESGKRPKFDIVTGISTGAFIATYAFLGTEYDEKLRDDYVLARPKDIYKKRRWISILNSDSFASSEPLRKKLDEAVTPELLAEVAKAHAEGRRLYVGTTNLDTRRAVIWDMGAIASSGKPDALELYRKIILASGALPGLFPPVLIDIEVDGKKYQELHVDGGVTASVFVPMALAECEPRKPCGREGSHVYVISSGKLYADSDTVRRQFLSVTYDSIYAMLYAGARNDIFRIFNQSLLCGMDFHLIAIPQKVALNLNMLSFEPKELRKLYEIGREMGRTQKGWRESPPGNEVDEQILPRTGTEFKTEK